MSVLCGLLVILGSLALGAVLERYAPNVASDLFPTNSPEEPQ